MACPTEIARRIVRLRSTILRVVRSGPCLFGAIREACDSFDVCERTIYRHVEALIEAGQVETHGEHNSTLYAAPGTSRAGLVRAA